MCKDSTISCCKNNDTQLIDMSKGQEISTDFSGPSDMVVDGSQVNGTDLAMFNFNTIAVATNYFSEGNKLGRGGFGPVHKVMFDLKMLQSVSL